MRSAFNRLSFQANDIYHLKNYLDRNFMAKSLMIVGISGFNGTVGRFLIPRYFQIVYTSVFPWDTFFLSANPKTFLPWKIHYR